MTFGQEKQELRKCCALIFALTYCSSVTAQQVNDVLQVNATMGGDSLFCFQCSRFDCGTSPYFSFFLLQRNHQWVYCLHPSHSRFNKYATEIVQVISSPYPKQIDRIVGAGDCQIVPVCSHIQKRTISQECTLPHFHFFSLTSLQVFSRWHRETMSLIALHAVILYCFMIINF